MDKLTIELRALSLSAPLPDEAAVRLLTKVLTRLGIPNPEGEAKRMVEERRRMADFICPKCKELLPHEPERWMTLNGTHDALSRRDNVTKICPLCGRTEGLYDYYSKSGIPLVEEATIRSMMREEDEHS